MPIIDYSPQGFNAWRNLNYVNAGSDPNFYSVANRKNQGLPFVLNVSSGTGGYQGMLNVLGVPSLQNMNLSLRWNQNDHHVINAQVVRVEYNKDGIVSLMFL